MPAPIQSLVSDAMRDLDAVTKLDDRELLATEWLWALRDRSVAIHELSNEQLPPLLIEDLLTIASLEGQGRKLAQTADSMMRFLDDMGKARVRQACFNDKRIGAMIATDEDKRIRLHPRHIPAAMSLVGIH